MRGIKLVATFSRKTEKQKAKLSASTGWVFRREGAEAILGPPKVAAVTDITVGLLSRSYKLY